MNPLKLLISSFFFCSWINRHHSSWSLAYLPAIALKAAAAERDADLTSYFLTTLFTFSDPLQVLKSLLMSGRVESGVLDEGDIFKKGFKTISETVLKCDAYITI